MERDQGAYQTKRSAHSQASHARVDAHTIAKHEHVQVAFLDLNTPFPSEFIHSDLIDPDLLMRLLFQDEKSE